MSASGLTVVKIGGSTLGRHDTSLDDIAALHAEGKRFVVVHGGGATITEWLAKLGVPSSFVRGLRVTDERALDAVVAVLGGLVNKRLVAELQARGAPAFGLSGADGGILRARRLSPDLGFVGEIERVDSTALRRIVEDGSLAVLAPIAVEEDAPRPQLLNINADTAAGEVAAALSADRLVFLTDVPGVLDGEGQLRPTLPPGEARRLLGSGAVTRGMIPKIETSLRAASRGVRAYIVDGREAGVLRTVLSGDPAGKAALPGTSIF